MAKQQAVKIDVCPLGNSKNTDSKNYILLNSYPDVLHLDSLFFSKIK